MKWKWTISVLTIPMVVAAVGIAAVDAVPNSQDKEAGKVDSLTQVAPTQQQVGDDSDRGSQLRTNVAAEPSVDDGGLIWDSRSGGLPMPVGGSPVECPEADACPDCEGDLNESGTVDGADLLILLSCWGPTDPACECSDFNSDSMVNGADLLVLLSGWGACPEGAGPGGDVFEETEACGDRDNDGCNADDPIFGPALACGDAACGTAWTGVEAGDPPSGQLPGTCEGFCGGQSDDGCWCDDQCFGFGDCCEDICEWCGPEDVPECASEVLVRDADWYPISVTETKQRMTFEVHAEFPATASVVYVDESCDLEAAITVASASGDPTVPFTLDACLQPGIEYNLVVVPTEFEGLPCDDTPDYGDAYVVTLACQDDPCPDQKGACCLGETCEVRDEVSCVIDGGVYLGDEVPCGEGGLCVGACCSNDGTCQMTSPEACINDVEGTFRGRGTTCSDMVPQSDCQGNEEMVPICRDCGNPNDPGEEWCNPDDVCNELVDVDPYNGGCNFFPEEPAFEQVCCNDTVGGQAWSISGLGRDLDWRVLEVKEPIAVTLTLNHSFGDVGLDGVLFLADSGCPSTIIQTVAGPDSVVIFRLLDPGTYYVLVAPDFVTEGDPDLTCDNPSGNYTLEISCGSQQTEICDGNCSGVFLEHPGYPAGFCSCDAAFCSGFTGNDPNDPDLCCPGVCTFCEEFGGVCDVPENAFCADAIPIEDGLTEYSTIGAPTDGPENPAGLCDDFGSTQTNHDIWYTYEATCTGELLVTTCEDLGAPPADYDTDLVIYSTTNCGALEDNLLACNDDDQDNSCGTAPPWASTIMTNVTQGTEYLIRVGGWGPDDQGNGTLLIECTPDP